jgi:diacylglycerol kinase (ATP)
MIFVIFGFDKNVIPFSMANEQKSLSKLFVIFNPNAAFGRAKKLLPKIEAGFSKKQINPEFKFTGHPKHAVEIASSLDFSRYDGLIVVGGDGTLFETVNGYFRNQSQRKIPVGVIPIGTGNAFSRDLGLRTNDYQRAIEIICRNNPQGTDVARFHTFGEDYYFINILGMGFITDVQEIAYKLKFFGNFSYTLGVLYQMIFLKKYQLKLELDGTVIDGKNIFVEFSNTRYTSNFLMAPNASFDDGFLDVTVLNPVSRFKMLTYFPSIFTGKHIHKKEISTYKAKHIRIETETPKALAPDGEIFGSSPFEIECLNKAIEIYRP